MNKHFRLVWTIGLAACAASLPAKADEFALGGVFGDPTGISLRGQVSRRAHVQSALGYGFFPGGGPTVTVDVRFDLHDFLRRNSSVALWFNLGPGFSVHWFAQKYFAYGRKKPGESDRFGFGLHALFGLRLAWRDEPFELVFDLSPFGLVATTHSEVFYDFEMAFGFRYRF